MTPKSTPTAQQIYDKFCEHFVSHHGDMSLKLTGICNPDKATETSICYITQKKYLEAVTSSKASVVISSSEFKDAAIDSSKTWLFSKNPELAVAQIQNEFFLASPLRNKNVSGVHPTAIVHETAKLGKNVSVGPYSIIADGVTINDDTYIGPHVTIEWQTTIGKNNTIHPNVYIGHNCTLGNDCEILPQATIGSEGFGYAHDQTAAHFRIPHEGKVIIGNRVHIGASTCIDRGSFENTLIGDDCIIDNLCHIAHNTEVGEKSMITAFFVSAGSAKIGKHFVSGGQTAVAGHIKVCDGVQVAACSVIHGNVTKPGKYGGYPLMPLKKYLQFKASLNHIVTMRKQFRKFMRQKNS